jgi:SAM-dependent methyltransferase
VSRALRDLAQAVAARHSGRATQGFVRGKLRGDPVLPALLALPPLGAVLDLGCGRGQLALALLLAGRADSIAGLDLDAGKIARATQAAAGLPARFTVADLATASIPPCDTVLLIDVLLQMPQEAQRAVLVRIAAASPARIVIRGFDPDRGWRSTAGFAMEHLRRWLGADLGRAGALAPLPIPAMAGMLEAAGYRVTVTPCWAGTPLPNVLMLAHRS